MAYFLRYLAAKNNKPKIKVTFASLGCLEKIDHFLAARSFRQQMQIIFSGKFENRQKLFDPIFSGHTQAAESIIGICFAVFPSHQK
jgi:hypothetical protein